MGLAMLSRGDLTDGEWAVLEPLLPVSNNRCGRWRNHRQVINGIIHRLGTGVQWRELPERFGLWKTVRKRHLLWSADGTWGGSCGTFGPPSTPKAASTGTSTSTPPSRALTSTPQEHLKLHLPRRALQKGAAEGQCGGCRPS
ncbi:Transposase and inactivated derivatives [Streptomyces sp. AmelKG-E11A]|nr:Transposase and inactivated derivatives [Streptomyces sp. AmelKG-E11A]